MPGIAVLTAFLLVLASIAVLVMYVQHIGQALRVSALIELVGEDTRALSTACTRTRERPLATRPATGDRARRHPASSRRRRRRPRRGGAPRRLRLELVPALGEFVPAEAPLFRVHGEPAGPDEDRLRRR